MSRVVDKVLNPVSRLVAPWMPGMGVVITKGRRSGRLYRAPVLVFPQSDDRFVLALTYGPEVNWVKNTLAADGCHLQTRGTTLELTAPVLYRDPGREDVPLFIAAMLVALGVDDFVSLDVVGTGSDEPTGEDADGDTR